jgi:Tfp pilus assembly protein PilO
MDTKRIWQLGAAILAIGILALGWFVGVSPQLDAASESSQQTAALRAANDQTQLVINGLAAQQKKLPDLKAQLAALLTSVPDSASMPPFVDELNAAATAASVQITGINVSDPQAYQPVAGTAPAPAATAAPTPDPTAAAGLPPVTNALITPQTMAVIPVSVTIKGPYANTLAFVKQLQSGARLYLVTTLTTSQDKSGDSADGAVAVTVSGFVYALTPQH